jgi:hypothetical protein
MRSLEAIVDLTLEPSDRPFALPASGSQSLLFRFGDTTFGGTLTSSGDEDFKPGGTYLGATLSLWHGDDSTIAPGATFVVWYDGDIGQGVVTPMP